MSKGPSGISSKDVKYKKYYNLKLEPKDWCGYHKGVCEIVNNIGKNYCWGCVHRKPLDIPEILEEIGKDKEK